MRSFSKATFIATSVKTTIFLHSPTSSPTSSYNPNLLSRANLPLSTPNCSACHTMSVRKIPLTTTWPLRAGSQPSRARHRSLIAGAQPLRAAAQTSLLLVVATRQYSLRQPRPRQITSQRAVIPAHELAATVHLTWRRIADGMKRHTMGRRQ